MSNYYKLNGHDAVPCDVMEWAAQFESGVDARRVGLTMVGEVRVSTVFLGLDHQHGEGAPLIFETMVFGGSDDAMLYRYSTWAQAEAGHASVVANQTAELAKPPTQEASVSEFFEDYDWKSAAEYANWKPDEVERVIVSSEGANDGDSWRVVVQLKDGRFSFLSAGCDYTGWDCQASGHSMEKPTLAELIRFGMGEEDRERLGLSMHGGGA